MPGHSRPQNGVASLAYAGIHAEPPIRKHFGYTGCFAAWIAGSSPAMTSRRYHPAVDLHPAARSAARMRCGVAGISSIATLKGDSASLTALIIAAGAPIAPPSPRPLAPVSEEAAGVSRWCSSIGGISRAVGG